MHCTFIQKDLFTELDHSTYTSDDLALALASFLQEGWDEIESILNRDYPKSQKDYIVHEWLFKLKDVGMLYRDSAYNLLKSEQFLRDNRIDQDIHNDLRNRISRAIQSANTELDYGIIDKDSSRLYEHTWKHSINPDSLIENQVSTLVEQLRELPTVKSNLDRLHQSFRKFYTQHDDDFSRTLDALGTYESILSSTRLILDSALSVSASSEYSALSIKIVEQIKRLEAASISTNYADIDIGNIKKLRLPLTTGESQLAVKSIDVESEINGWHLFSCMPEVKDMDTAVRSFEDRIEAMLFQLNNRLVALAELNLTAASGNLEDMGQTIDYLHNELNAKIYKRTEEKIAHLKTSLRHNVSTSQLYSEEYNFLPISRLARLAGSSSYTATTPLERWGQAKSWLINYTNGISGRFKASSERMVDQVAKFHHIHEKKSSSFILKKGYIGHSFVSERTKLLAKIDTVVQHWKRGFGQAIFVHGLHGSGRSTLLDAIRYRYPDKKFYILRPDQKLEIEGHQYTKNKKNLIDRVESIVRQSPASRTVIAIDSLDGFYTSPEVLFLKFDKLTQLINKNSKDFLFIVLGHSKLQEKLSRYIDMDLAFTSTISCDHMPRALMSETIYRRVQAVHSQEVIDEKGEYYTDIVKEAVNRANGNIGFAILQFKHLLIYGTPIDLHSPELEQLIVKYKDIFVEFISHGHIEEDTIREMYNDIGKKKIDQFFNTMTNAQILHHPQNALIGIHEAVKLPIDQIIRNL